MSIKWSLLFKDGDINEGVANALLQLSLKARD